MLKHIWKYLTSPTYRYWIDFCSRQENLDKTMKQIQDTLWLQTHPMFYSKGGEIKDLSKLLIDPGKINEETIPIHLPNQN